MNETELYQEYADCKETVQTYINRMVIPANPAKDSSFDDDIHVLECICHSLLRKIEFIREYKKTH